MKFKRSVLYLLLSGTIQISALAQTNEERPIVIEAVECRGNKLTTCEFIKNKLRLGAATTVTDEKVQDAQLRLSALSDFESVRVLLEKGSEVGKARLVVEVVEASPIVTEFALGAQNFSIDVGDYPGPKPPSRWYETIEGRISNQNVFGSHKIVSLSVAGFYSAHEDSRDSNATVTAAYIDPNVLGMDSLFFSAKVNFDRAESHYQDSEQYVDPTTGDATTYSFDERYESEKLGINLSAGYRLWSYSYFLGSYDYQRIMSSKREGTVLISDGQGGVFISDNDGAIVVGGSGRIFRNASVGVGWDSEDDRYFPTRGMRASILAYRNFYEFCAECDKTTWGAALKQTWGLTGRSIITVNVGGEPAATNDKLRPLQATRVGDLGITYSYVLPASELIRRGRWYVYAGSGPFRIGSYERIGGHPDQGHVALGVRFESRLLGLVDLKVTGSRFWPRELH